MYFSLSEEESTYKIQILVILKCLLTSSRIRTCSYHKPSSCTFVTKQYIFTYAVLCVLQSRTLCRGVSRSSVLSEQIGEE
jgi:hypothetical protein